MGSKLVIVESPAKAKTLASYLGKEFKVKASVGHIVDLPKKSLGIDIKRDFRPRYEILPEKRKVAKELKESAKSAEIIYLASDPDREGEAIAWHIAGLLKDKDKPIKRVLINEITKKAVKEAIDNAGELNKDRFEAQQARRVLDRLVGYLISPLLWKKVGAGLSAGRVQSVALRLICEREEEIRKFKPEEYWTIEAVFKTSSGADFVARLSLVNGDKPKLSTKQDADGVLEKIKALALFRVKRVETKERKRNAPSPFITATLQQEASKRLGFPAKKTMFIAQTLYEGVELGDAGRIGLITYMRTDSVRVNEEMLSLCRQKIEEKFGRDYLPSKAIVHRSKKSAQEAHEAIRPTVLEYTPEYVKQYLTEDQLALYRMIYQRFLASQMKPAIFEQKAVEIEADGFIFKATGTVVKFAGFLKADPDYESEEKEDYGKLPLLKEGEILNLVKVESSQHFTQPPPRYTEASLIKELEQKGIGRPSTYAQIVSTIQEREYVKKEKGVFKPTALGFFVNKILVHSFSDLVNVKFTAQMEEKLDRVENSELNWVELLREFYIGFSKELEKAPKMIDRIRSEVPADVRCPNCGKELLIKFGKKGEFIACAGYPQCDFTSSFERDENGGIVLKSFGQRKGKEEPTDLSCPSCSRVLVIKRSGRGEFLGCSGYPECKFSASLERDENGKPKIVTEEKTGIACDKCGKEMIIRRKANREFLACSGYPDCRNTKSFRRDAEGKIEPVLQRERFCPNCNKPLKLRKGRYGFFWGCTGYPECNFIEPIKRKKKATG